MSLITAGMILRTPEMLSERRCSYSRTARKKSYTYFQLCILEDDLLKITLCVICFLMVCHTPVSWSEADGKHDTLLTGLLLIWVEAAGYFLLSSSEMTVDALLRLRRLIQQKSVWAPPSGCGWVCTLVQAGCQQHHLLVGADSCEIRVAAHWCVCVSGSDEGPGRKCKVLWVHSWDLPSCPGSGLKLQGRGRCWRLPPPAHLSCWLVISLWSCWLWRGGASAARSWVLNIHSKRNAQVSPRSMRWAFLTVISDEWRYQCFVPFAYSLLYFCNSSTAGKRSSYLLFPLPVTALFTPTHPDI